MLAHGDIEAVNLGTGEQQRRVTGNGEQRLELTVFLLWREWASKREKETTWRREFASSAGNMALDQFLFTEGFKQGVLHALSKRP